MKRVLLTGAVLAALAFATQATAANYQVMLGEQQFCGFGQPCKGITGVPKGTTLDKFLPGTVVINAGDTVTYSSASFHTVSYAPKVPPLLMPDPAKGKYASLKDAAGTPFYFSGLPKFIYNGLAFGPYGPKTVSGSTGTSSGALSPAGPKAKPATFTYTYPKTGTYHMFCNIHPGMKGTIVVRAAGAPVPKTPAQVIAQGLAEQAASWAQAKAAVAASHPPKNTVYMGVGNGATVLGYLPETLTVKAGTTVTFVNKIRPGGAQRRVRAEEVHPRPREDDRPVPDGPEQPEPGLAVPHLRLRAEGAIHLRWHESRQRVPLDAADLRFVRRADPAGLEGDVQQAREVQLLLLDPRA